MPLSLDEWLERVEQHFSELARARSGSGFPLFALEHGLSEDDVDAIGTLLKARLAEGARLSRHWLLWVVYATELGYDYDGEEYWTSFEERTPKWWQSVTSSRRNQLREWFAKFHATYDGVRPTGPWAEHFSIIAWPITHAVLPKYLQWQFARNLFSLRYQLAHLESTTPEFVGNLLAANAWDTSSRFQQFAEQEELTGRIVLALLTDREVEGQSPIYLPTLRRLVSDLEQVQAAREWLKETRLLVADRLKGAVQTRDGSPGGRETRTPALTVHAPLRLRPTVTLRRSSKAEWSAVLDIPSFAPAAKVNPELRAFLASTRCKIAGINDGWLARRWLLTGPRRRVLTSWPAKDAPLIGFEQSNESLVQLVNAEARLPVGPVWLFRIGNDNIIARPILTRVVRPGGKYVLLTEATLPWRDSLLRSSTIECDGVNAAALSIPTALSSQDLDVLDHLGLAVARTIRIAPAGLIARAWDGEGDSEWLTTDTPCFSIVCDHPLDHYKIRLGGGPDTTVTAPSVGVPIFLKVSPLPPGKHTLTVKGRRQYHGVAEVEGTVTLNVREPEPWVSGTTAHAGLVIALDPPDPTLDGFWEGNVGLSILGPAGHVVTCSITLGSAGGKELLSEPIGSFPLPVTTADWRKHYGPFVSNERRAWIYPEAAAGRFVISGEELGEYAISLERSVKPVRWAYRTIHRAATLRLIDECGMDTEAACRLFSFATPAQPVALDIATIQAAFEIQLPGGLFEVKHGEFTDTIIVSPQVTGGLQNLESLAVQPDLRPLSAPDSDVFDMLSLLSLWSEARAVGPLVRIRHVKVLKRLLSRLYAALCGGSWAQAEDSYLSNHGSEPTLQRLLHSVGDPYGFALVLRRDFDRMEAGKDTGVRWFAQVAARYHVCPDEGFCEFALRLASVPYQLLRWPRPALEPLFREIKERSVLLRGARLVALLAITSDPQSRDMPVPRWQW